MPPLQPRHTRRERIGQECGNHDEEHRSHHVGNCPEGEGSQRNATYQRDADEGVSRPLPHARPLLFTSPRTRPPMCHRIVASQTSRRASSCDTSRYRVFQYVAWPHRALRCMCSMHPSFARAVRWRAFRLTPRSSFRPSGASATPVRRPRQVRRAPARSLGPASRAHTPCRRRPRVR